MERCYTLTCIEPPDFGALYLYILVICLRNSDALHSFLDVGYVGYHSGLGPY